MRKTILTIALTVLICTPALAQDAPLLGRNHFAAELDLMFLQHETFDTDDVGIYLGISSYWHLRNNWYLGGELGTGAAIGFFGLDSSGYVPIEVNAKRAYGLSENWIAGLGAGLSMAQVRFVDNIWNDDNVTHKEWVPGFQVLADLIFQAGDFQIGLKTKYQLTTDLDKVAELTDSDGGWDYSNFKIGLQVGFRIPE
ncbi:MAG: hypothetical protein GY838_17230 [bacterium]|nr:hypothetical protein [bacterium]